MARNSSTLAATIAIDLREDDAMPYQQTCPRCGREFEDDDKAAVADAVVAHARDDHRHTLDREVVLAHLEGVHPYERAG